ncbi:MAG: DUF6596 domain-containing protein [Pseudomonadota bacterium]
MTMRATTLELERVARTAYGRLLGRLARRTRDLQTAEDALGDALARALEVWPRDGVPNKPEAWLITVARNRITDQARRGITAREGETEVLLRQAERDAAAEDATSWPLPDPRLALLFACADPSVPEPARSPLMLQTVLGLSAARIAPLFLVSAAALGQQLSRAKAALAKTGSGLTPPPLEDWPGLLPPVLQTIYGAFAAGLDARDEELAHEATYLSELCHGVMPGSPEASGLHALCLYRLARFGADLHEGEFIPLEEQNPEDWNTDLISRAESVLRQAARKNQPGRYQLEAAIQSAHIHMCLSGEDKWQDVIGFYTTLSRVAPSLGAVTGHAGALLKADRPTQSLNLLRTVEAEAKTYQPWWATYAAALAATGQKEEAAAAYDQAADLCEDTALVRFLEKRRQQLFS